MPETQEIQKIEVKTITPFLDTVNAVLLAGLNKDVDAVVSNINRAIERGVKTDDTLNEGNTFSQEGFSTIKAIREVRLTYTRPLDEAKKFIMSTQEEPLVRKVKEPLDILYSMVTERDDEIKEEKARLKREAEEKQRAIDEAARKEEERRKNISLGKGGNGDFKPVEREVTIQPTAQIGMRSTVRRRSVVDNEAITMAVKDGVREIPGVHIYQVWTWELMDAQEVPKEYRRLIRG